MDILQILIYIIILYSITDIVVNGDIFYEVRQFFFRTNFLFAYNILTCTTCFSVWLGFTASAFTIFLTDTQTPVQMLFGNIGVLTIFFDGVFASGAVALLYKVFQRSN